MASACCSAPRVAIARIRRSPVTCAIYVIGESLTPRPETRMAERVICKKCGCECSDRHMLCDRVDGAWCRNCFAATPCGRGRHGEGCATAVFDDSPVPAGDNDGR